MPERRGNENAVSLGRAPRTEDRRGALDGWVPSSCSSSSARPVRASAYDPASGPRDLLPSSHPRRDCDLGRHPPNRCFECAPALPVRKGRRALVRRPQPSRRKGPARGPSRHRCDAPPRPQPPPGRSRQLLRLAARRLARFAGDDPRASLPRACGRALSRQSARLHESHLSPIAAGVSWVDEIGERQHRGDAWFGDLAEAPMPCLTRGVPPQLRRGRMAASPGR